MATWIPSLIHARNCPLGPWRPGLFRHLSRMPAPIHGQAETMWHSPSSQPLAITHISAEDKPCLCVALRLIQPRWELSGGCNDAWEHGSSRFRSLAFGVARASQDECLQS